jgi:hypothetical protein
VARTLIEMINEIRRNVEKSAGESVKKKIMEGSRELTATSKKEKVSTWVKEAMARMDALLDEKTRSEIMKNCGYNCALHNKRVIDGAKKRRMKFKSLEEFMEAEQRKPMVGTKLAKEGGRWYWYFIPQSFKTPMRCFCGLLRGLPPSETISRSYCQCSKGFVEKYWEGVVGKPVSVDLLQSAISGAKECKFAIHV